MIQYMSAREAAQKWNISQRRVSVLCSENRIPNAAMLGNMWIIPINASKPNDARKSNNQKATEKARPFIKWAGGKTQILQALKDNLPKDLGTKITKYAEPFVGGGALLFSLLEEYSFDKVYISDTNKELMNTYQAIKDNCPLLSFYLSELQNEYNSLSPEQQEKLYYEKRNLFNEIELTKDTCIEKATLFIFLNKSCFNGLYRVNKKGMFNVPFGKHKSISICDVENLNRISSLLANVEIKACDYSQVLNFVDSSTFVYFDPPYRPLNATSGFTSYTEDQFSDKNQAELGSFYKKLSDIGATLMLSNSDPKNVNENDNFFDDLYADFNILRIEASRMINSRGNSRGKIKELLIKNY